MKTLILSDETAEAMLAALRSSELGGAVLASFDQTPPVPAASVMHAARREKTTPAAFVDAAQRHAAATDAADQTRARLHELIRYAHAAGIGTTPLSRWTGLSTTALYKILSKETS